MVRILPGIVLGSLLAFAAIWAIESLSGALYPLPLGFDPYTTASLGIMLQYKVPMGAKLLMVAGWCLGTLLGGAVAAYVARRRIGAWIVAALVVAGALATARSITHTPLMIAAGLILPWICAWAVQRLAHVRRGLF